MKVTHQIEPAGLDVTLVSNALRYISAVGVIKHEADARRGICDRSGQASLVLHDSTITIDLGKVTISLYEPGSFTSDGKPDESAQAYYAALTRRIASSSGRRIQDNILSYQDQESVASYWNALKEDLQPVDAMNALDLLEMPRTRRQEIKDQLHLRYTEEGMGGFQTYDRLQDHLTLPAMWVAGALQTAVDKRKKSSQS